VTLGDRLRLEAFRVRLRRAALHFQSVSLAFLFGPFRVEVAMVTARLWRRTGSAAPQDSSLSGWPGIAPDDALRVLETKR